MTTICDSCGDPITELACLHDSHDLCEECVDCNECLAEMEADDPFDGRYEWADAW